MDATHHQLATLSQQCSAKRSTGIRKGFIIPSTNIDHVSIWKKKSLCKWATIGVYLTWIVYGCRFFLFLFSVWGTFPCYLLHFGAKTSTLLNVGAKICYLHCSSIFPWFYMIFPWCSLIYPKCSSILNSVH